MKMKQGTKNILLLAGFILILILAYNYSFSKTFEVKDRLNELNLQIAENSNRSFNQAELGGRELYLDSIINKGLAGSNSLQNNLLEVLNDYSTKFSFKIISFQQPHIYAFEDKTEITSFQFVLEGKYEALEKTLYELEKNYSFGSLAHISFEKKKNYKLNKVFLQCSVVMQNVK